jgi:hypothetical protein
MNINEFFKRESWKLVCLRAGRFSLKHFFSSASSSDPKLNAQKNTAAPFYRLPFRAKKIAKDFFYLPLTWKKAFSESLLRMTVEELKGMFKGHSRMWHRVTKENLSPRHRTFI